ncbi:MAG: type IV secretion system protein [Gammaproteobacteria bacterium]|jgi:type IV secretion system protein VirB6
MFITELMQTIDTQIQDYTFNAYQALVTHNINSIRLLVAMYFMFLGYQYLMASKPVFNIPILHQVLLVVFCYYTATHWSVFAILVYDLAVALPDQLAVTLVSVVPNVPDQVSGIELLEYIWFSGLDIAATIWGAISISAIHQGLMALGVLIMTLFLVGYGLLVISLAKMIMAIGLSLAPLFIILFMFKQTQRFSFGWLQVVLIAMLKQIIIFAMIAMVYAIIYGSTEALLQQETLDMMDVASFLLLLFISSGLFLTASRVAILIGTYHDKK